MSGREIDVSGMTTTVSVPRDLLDRAITELTEYTDSGGCDHSVGICWCDVKGIVRDLTQLREGTATTISHIEYVAIEQSPLDSPIADPEVDAYIDEYDNLPDVFETALGEVVRNVDATKCGYCSKGVGYVAIEDDDYPQRSGTRWRALWLVREDGGPVGFLCEECSPVSPNLNR